MRQPMREQLYPAKRRRAAGLLLSSLIGLTLASALLWVIQPPRPAQAQPAAAPAAFTYPSASAPCNTTLQHCINNVAAGSTVNVEPGLYITSVTINRAVSVVGAGVGSTVIQALPGRRVMSVTVAMTASTLIANMTLQEGNAGAELGGGLYLTFTAQPLLQNLLIFANSASAGGGIFAYSDITLDNVTVSNNTATNDGGGMAAYGNLVATDSVFQNNTVITGGSGGGLQVFGAFSGANVSFLSNTVTAGGVGGGLGVDGALTLTGGMFVGNRTPISTTYSGGGLFTFGPASISGTQFIHNASGWGGGAAIENLATSGSSVLTNVQFISNTAVGSGGGLWMAYSSTLTAVDFLSNTATGFGGGAYAGFVLDFATALQGGRFVSNTAASGGGLYSDSSFTLAGTQFLSNTALNGYGGGARSLLTATVTGATFAYNTATPGNGGGLDTAGNLFATNTSFVGNRALTGGGGGSSSGGTIALTNVHYTSFSGGGALTFSPATVAGSQFLSNTTNNFGGGLSADSAFVHDSLFQGNHAPGNWGGGAFIYRNAAISDTQFLNNTSASAGGGLAVQLGACSLLRDTLQSNTALAGGGAYCVGTGGISAVGTQFQANTASANGGGILALSVIALDHAVFTANQSGGHGGAVDVSGTLTVSSTLVTGNFAADGGGLYLAAGGGRIVNSLFANNAASNQDGMQLYLAPTGALQLWFSTVGAPSLVNGDAIRVAGSGSVELKDSIVTNHATGLNRQNSTVTEDYNLFFGNSLNIFGNVSSGPNRFSGDPRFASPTAGDYHLRAGSAALDHALDLGVTTDVDGQPRPFGAGFDLGYDELELLQLYLPLVRR